MKPTKPGIYLYRKPGNRRFVLAHVTRGTNGRLYATFLRRRSTWKSLTTYVVGSMGGEWLGKMTMCKRKKNG